MADRTKLPPLVLRIFGVNVQDTPIHNHFSLEWPAVSNNYGISDYNLGLQPITTITTPIFSCENYGISYLQLTPITLQPLQHITAGYSISSFRLISTHIVDPIKRVFD
ncbi:hypothetical protein RclHR1_15910003 [Rhizophagus clarus]|uniref:Uncharacterized protein n=1 Tax=Rhizophagus clarus TaxID=94130 RepID=A0A2Z6QHZ6_9GLOM|nr:hypothetical protein RclHR1_15910003 [Rhizophagus clarus]GES86100.1 hypothetical protein RCL_e3648_RclHR1_15910003 [Rhizophagus clarus]